MVIIDASIWVAFFNEDDKFHERAKDIFRLADSNGDKIVLPAIAFTEVAGVIKRVLKDGDAAWESVWYMMNMEPEVLSDFSKLEPIATKIAINYGVKGMDAYYLAVAELTKSRLYTFDTQQEEAFEAISKNGNAIV